jgi:hypothetical protein
MDVPTGQKLLDREGNAIGKITDVVANPTTVELEWLTVKTGLMGGEHLVPFEAVETTSDGTLMVPFTKEQVKSAPADAHIAPSGSERSALYGHYGLPEPDPEEVRSEGISHS